jgi:hypothetical protein
MEHTVELDEVITDRAGRYRFTGLAPGGYRLELLLTKKGGHAFAGSPFEVFAAETTVFDLTFR